MMGKGEACLKLPASEMMRRLSERNKKCLYFELYITLFIVSQFVFYEGIPGSTLEPMWISKFRTRKHIISSLRKHLMLGPVVSKPIPVVSKITSKTKEAGRNRTNTRVIGEQNG